MIFEHLTDFLLIAALAAGGIGAWRLNRRLKSFREMLPELQAEIERLNAGIATAEATLARMRHEAVRVDAGAARAPAPRHDQNRGRALRSLMAAMKREAA